MQDLYARLLRYDFAARRLSAAETGLEPEPDAYLALRVRDIRSDGGAAGDQAAAEASSGLTIRLERQTQCYKGDPCHASYVVGWDTGDGGAASQAVTGTVAGPVVRVTTYQVTLTLAGETREYTAQVRYHAAPEGGGILPEVVDPVIPGLQQLVDDRTPLATPRWDTYVRTRRYAAVVQRLKGLTRAGKATPPGRRPIGFLPGDDVTPQDVAMAMMAPGEPCGVDYCTGRANGDWCPDEGNPSCSVDKCRAGTCEHTEVTTVSPHSPDPYPVDIGNLTAGTQAALTCFQQAIQNIGGSIVVTSGFRPQSYQDHLREVWDKWQLIAGWPEAECANVKSAVEAEWDRHDLKYRPAAQSNHTVERNAFDANVSVPPGQNEDTLGAGCGLSRAVPGDWVHWVFGG